WQFNRKITRFLTLENASDISASAAVGIDLARSITHQSARTDDPCGRVASRNCLESSNADQLVAPTIKERTCADEYRTSPCFRYSQKGSIDFLLATGFKG